MKKLKCSKCQEFKDENEFHKDSNTRGRRYWCKNAKKYIIIKENGPNTIWLKVVKEKFEIKNMFTNIY